MGDGALDGFGVSGFAELDESGVLMQDVPHDLAQPVSDRPDSLDISQTDDQAFEYSLQLTSVGSDGGLRSLAE